MCVDITLPCPRLGPLQNLHQEVCIRSDRKAQGTYRNFLHRNIEITSQLRISFHSKEICANNAKNARGTFDDKEQRLKGTDAEAYKDVSVRDHKVKNKWKKTHSNMINAIKEAKKNRPPTAMANIDVHIVT